MRLVTKNNESTTPFIIHFWYFPTYENPHRFSIRFVFAKLVAEHGTQSYTNTLDKIYQT